MILETRFDIGQPVHADGDPSIRLRIVLIEWDGVEPMFKATWWHEGTLNDAWFREWRLSAAEADNRDPARETWPRVGT